MFFSLSAAIFHVGISLLASTEPDCPNLQPLGHCPWAGAAEDGGEVTWLHRVGQGSQRVQRLILEAWKDLPFEAHCPLRAVASASNSWALLHPAGKSAPSSSGSWSAGTRVSAVSGVQKKLTNPYALQLSHFVDILRASCLILCVCGFYCYLMGFM